MSRLSSFNDSTQIIGTRIREKREQWHMSQQEVADAIDVTLNYLGEIERGRRPLTLPVAEQLCLLFGVTYDYLYLGLERPNGEMISEPTPSSGLNARSALIDIACSSDESDCEDYLTLLRDVRRMVDKASRQP